MNIKPMLTKLPIYIKSYEIDAVGIVSNIVYIRWFEDLRHAFLDNYYPYPEMMRANVSPILMKTNAEYKKPLGITDSAMGQCWVSKLTNMRWVIDIEITSKHGIHCIGKQSGCFFDVVEQRPAKTPDTLLCAYNQETSA